MWLRKNNNSLHDQQGFLLTETVLSMGLAALFVSLLLVTTQYQVKALKEEKEGVKAHEMMLEVLVEAQETGQSTSRDSINADPDDHRLVYQEGEDEFVLQMEE